MRTNHLKEKIRRGEPANGVLVSWPCPEMVEFFGYLGFDYVFIDAEHGAIGRESCAALVLASHAAGITPLVRVPENNPATILGYLETGAHGVVVPHVSSAAEAEAVVRAVKYSPLGRRSGSSASRLTGYGALGTTREYFAWANDEILVYVEIEDREGIENLDDILAVPGVDIVGLGP
ncbi:MAG: hypothetical protein KC442_21700, partial [Thermomicrobiales bacterium]|nr:hypothetical protein [Thermomicrobiales bacterium]